MGHINMTQADLPSYGKRKKKLPKLPTIVQPARKCARARASAPSQPSSAAPSDGLKSLLSQLGFSSLWPLFVTEQVNISIVASWDLAAMKAYFPNIAAGPATQILQACKAHVGSSICRLSYLELLYSTSRLLNLSLRLNPRRTPTPRRETTFKCLTPAKFKLCAVLRRKKIWPLRSRARQGRSLCSPHVNMHQQSNPSATQL